MRGKPVVVDPIISELLRARTSKGLRQQDVADAAGISRRALVSIEAGNDCTLTTLRALATALGIQIEARVQGRSFATAEAMSAHQQQRELIEALRVQDMSPTERSQWLSSAWGRLQQQATSIHRDLKHKNLRVRHFATLDAKNRHDDEQEIKNALDLALSRGGL
jgi:transcriptional regulator with XRE-family HTH domain